jgi:hypothetical protein
MTLRAVSTLALVSLLTLATGCAAVGNVLFTPHPSSLSSVDPTLDLVPCVGTQAVPAAAAGVALAALQAFLKSEAARYRATYSAAASKDVGTTCFRFVGDGLASFKGKIATTATASRVVNGTFKPEATKSKVASWPVRTWTTGQNPFAGQGWGAGLRTAFGIINPIMWLHALWGWAEDDLYKLNYAARIKIETIDPADREAKSGESVIPIGRFSIDEIAGGTASKSDLGSAFIARPGSGSQPTNVTITIVEANDLGDVIGRGAELVEDRSFADKLKGFFGN